MRRAPRRGFFVFDAVVSALLLTALAGALLVAVTLYHRARTAGEAQRRALRLAERALIEPAAVAAEGVGEVTFTEVGRSAGGSVWVEAAATIDGRTARLVALLDAVPADAEGGSR